MSNFVRGGQLTLHSVRMVRQVLYFLWLISLSVMVVTVPTYVYYNTTSFQRAVTLRHYIAIFKVSIGQEDEQVSVIRENGLEDTITAAVLANHPPVIENTNFVWGVILDAIQYTLIGLVTLMIAVIAFFIRKGKKLNAPDHLRGGDIADAAELKSKILSDNKKQKVKSYEIAGIPYPAYSESQHTWITGGPGSGKTVILSELIAQIRARGDRAIIYDRTGSYTKWFYQADRDVIMNPLDARSVSWSPFVEGNASADFETMAAAMMPTEKGNVDPFWTNAARVLFSSVCSRLSEQGNTYNEILCDSLLKTDLGHLAELIKGTPAQAIIDTDSPKTALSVMSVISANVGSMKFLKDTGDIFSIRDWIMDEKESNFMFVSSRADQHASIRPLISTWLEIAINSLLSLDQSRDRKIWIILDELPSLHYLPSLQPGLAESRQFGGAFVLGLQVVPQLQAIYGHDVARATSGLCQTRIVLKSADSDTARMGAESLGRSETEEHKEGLSYGAHEMRDGININTHRSTQNLILPTEIMNLPNLTGYVRFGMEYPVAKVTVPYVERKVISPGFVPNEEFTDTAPRDEALPVEPETIPESKKEKRESSDSSFNFKEFDFGLNE